MIGNFGEIGTVGDMIRTGIAITELGGQDNYDDVDRWVRNQLIESQIDADMAAHIENNNSPDFRFDHIGHKVEGSFISDATHSLAFPKNKNLRWNVDGCANAMPVAAHGGTPGVEANIRKYPGTRVHILSCATGNRSPFV